jgi:hypothetical protein
LAALLEAHAEAFHFTRHQAAKQLGQIARAVESWADQARGLGIESDEIEAMGAAFAEAYRRQAYELTNA